MNEEREVSEGVHEYIVEAFENVDIRKRVFYALAEINAPILLMQSADLSLEEVFLRLTNDTQYKKVGGKK